MNSSSDSYASKIDGWMVALLILVPAGLFAAALVKRAILPVILCGIVLVLYRLVLLPVSYRFASEALHIRTGVIRTRIPYRAIRAVRATHSPLAAPALSLDRLAIEYGTSEVVLVSPRSRAAFVHDLSDRVPGLHGIESLLDL